MAYSGKLDMAVACEVRLGMEHAGDLLVMTDEELLEHSLKHPAAFELLVARYQRTFLERAQYVVKSADEAEDVVQEAFIRIYRFAPRFSGNMGSFKSWSITILMNAARTRYQQLARGRARFALLAPEHYVELAAPDAGDASEAKDIIERSLQHLPKDAAHILDLAFLKALPYREIAAREGISEGAVKTRVHRAKKMLRDTIGDITI